MSFDASRIHGDFLNTVSNDSVEDSTYCSHTSLLYRSTTSKATPENTQNSNLGEKPSITAPRLPSKLIRLKTRPMLTLGLYTSALHVP
jgi:hypothetical protein